MINIMNITKNSLILFKLTSYNRKRENRKPTAARIKGYVLPTN